MATKERAASQSTAPGPGGAGQRLLIRILGGFELEVDGAGAPGRSWGRTAARQMVKVLAATPGHALHREQLMDLLWPELSPESVQSGFRNALHHARHVIDAGAAASRLDVDRDMVRLVDVEVDADVFEQSAQRALTLEAPALVGQAIDLYRGELLPEDRYEDWAAGRREALSRLHSRLLRLRAAQLESEESYEEAAATLARNLESDPVDEAAHRELMRLYVLAGRRHEALRQYETCRRVLKSELEVEPEPETEDLYREIVAGRGPLAPHQRVPLPPIVAKRTQESTVVGREVALELLNREARQAARGHGGMVVVGGEAGVGKTRLLAELCRILHEQGAVVLWGASYEQEESVPYGPMVEALGQHLQAGVQSEAALELMARLDPSQSVGNRRAASGPESGSDHPRLYRAAIQALDEIGGSHLLVLALDDLHLSDRSTLSLISYLAREALSRRWLIVGSYREEEARFGSHFGDVLAPLLRHETCRRVLLMRLSREESDRLVAQRLSRGEVPDHVAARIHDLAQGNPLYVRELLASMTDRGPLRLEGGRWTLRETADPSVPEQIRDIIETRARSVSARARKALSLAAVAGAHFTFQELEASSVLPAPDLLDALDEMLASRLVEERDEGYGFYHPLVRATLYTSLSRERRQELHQRLAEGLESTGAAVETLAHHYLHARRLDQALPYLEAAGDRAASAYAHALAEMSYREMLRVSLELGQVNTAARARQKLGMVLFIQGGRWDEAIDLLQQAASELSALGQITEAGRVVAWLGRAHQRRGSLDEGLKEVETMLARLPETEAITAAALQIARCVLIFSQGRYTEALAAADAAARSAVRGGSEALRVEALMRRATVLELLNRWQESAKTLEDVLPSVEERGDLVVLFSTLHNFGTARFTLGDNDRAEGLLRRAIEVAERSGERDQMCLAYSTMGNFCLELGRWEEAETYYRRGVDTAEELGRSSSSAEPFTRLGVLETRRGNWQEAEKQLSEAENRAHSAGTRQTQMIHATSAAELALMQGDWQGAILRLEPFEEAELLDQVGRLFLGRAQWASPDAGLRQAGDRLLRSLIDLEPREPRVALAAAALLGDALTRSERLEEAEPVVARGLELARRFGSPYFEAMLLIGKARICRGRSDCSGCTHAANAAARIAKSLGAGPLLVEAESLAGREER